MVDIVIIGSKVPEGLVLKLVSMGLSVDSHGSDATSAVLALVIDDGKGSGVKDISSWTSAHPLRPLVFNMATRSNEIAKAAVVAGAIRVEIGQMDPFLLAHYVSQYKNNALSVLKKRFENSGRSHELAMAYIAHQFQVGHWVSEGIVYSMSSGRWDWQSTGSGLRVLVVEDDHSLHDVFKMVLGIQGYQVSIAESGAAALASLQTQPKYDLMICDVGLPDIRGEALIGRILAIYPDMDLTMVSAFFDSETVKACLSAGAADYIVKPFLNAQLLKSLAHSTIRRACNWTVDKSSYTPADPYRLLDTMMAVAVVEGSLLSYGDIQRLLDVPLKPGLRSLDVVPELLLGLSARAVIQSVVDPDYLARVGAFPLD